MCGIVGIFDLEERRTINKELLIKMNESQFHRGPDQGGIHIDAGIGLGHRRLSIIDLSSGIQPLFNEDDSVVVVYNGEIYNFAELSLQLADKGHKFKTHCDTEVIVHAWEEWGERCVDYFRGMFAFAIYDQNKNCLFLARDRLGIKPLYYAVLSSGFVIFSSELKAIMVHPELKRELDVYAVEDYFGYGYIPEPKTIIKDARKLLPGHTLLFNHGKTEFLSNQYWDIPFEPNGVMSEQEAVQGLVERLTEAVKIRLLAEVPLGAFLSGGVDSSAVVSAMAGLSDSPVNTCSISFGDPEFNEAIYAKQVAERYHTNHQVGHVAADDFDLIDILANIYDEPFADSSAMPTYRVCELARKKVTVALSGDGGDENLAGYRRYQWHLREEKIRSILPLSLRRPIFGFLGKTYPKLDWAPKFVRGKSTFESMARDYVEGYFHSVSILADPLRKKLFSKQFRSDLQGYQASEVLRQYAIKSPTEHPLSRIQYMDMKTYLVGDILTKVDRASMAHSLEVRVPILDHKLVEWMSGLPPQMKLRGTEGKYIFKKSMQPFLSNDILYRKKMGFAVPLATWFRGPLKNRIRNSILGENLMGSGMFDPSFVKRLVDQHQSGRRDNSAAIWALLMFEAFQRKVLQA
ncbi:MAG: XrtA/PEP-CTERM system amidotransferase [Thiohalomonadales bacterium]